MPLLPTLLSLLLLAHLNLADNLQCWGRVTVNNAADCQLAIDLIPTIRLNVESTVRNELDRPQIDIEFTAGAKTFAQQTVFHHGSCLVVVANRGPRYIRLSQDSRAMHYWPAVRRRAQSVWTECIHGQGKAGMEEGFVPSSPPSPSSPLGSSPGMEYIVRVRDAPDKLLRALAREGFEVVPPFLAPGY